MDLEFVLNALLRNDIEQLERISDLLLSIDPKNYGDSIHSIITDLVTRLSNDLYDDLNKLEKVINKEKKNV